jgi:hypothetical protein
MIVNLRSVSVQVCFHLRGSWNTPHELGVGAYVDVPTRRPCRRCAAPALRYEFVVGFTRLGNLLGALDRGDVPEVATHRVWIGQRQ